MNFGKACETLGVIVEMDYTSNEFYFKYRMFPCGAINDSLRFSENGKWITDTFYDDSDFSFGSQQNNFRKREFDHRSNESEVKKYFTTLSSVVGWDGYVHANVDAVFDTHNNGLEPFLSYKFLRQEALSYDQNQTPLFQHNLRIYKDTIQLKSFTYSVVSFRRKITFDSVEYVFQQLIDFVSATTNNKISDAVQPNCYPTFSKFMYMLRVSVDYELYEDIFEAADSCAKSVYRATDKYLDLVKSNRSESARLPAHVKEYLWAVLCIHMVLKSHIHYNGEEGCLEKCFKRIEEHEKVGYIKDPYYFLMLYQDVY